MMKQTEIQNAVQKYLLITSYYGWSYNELEDTYLAMPFYEIMFKDGEYILPTKRPSQFDEEDIDYLQSSLDEFLLDNMSRDIDSRQAHRLIDSISSEYPDKAASFRQSIRKYYGQGYIFTNGQDVLDTPESLRHALRADESQVHLKHRFLNSIEYIFHYKDDHVLDLKSTATQIPLAPIDDMDD